MSTTALAPTVAPLVPLVRAESGASSAAARSSQAATTGFMVGLWIRLGLAGMFVVGASLVALLLGEASIGAALVGLVAGCGLTVGAWRHTRSALGEASDAAS